MVLPSFVKLVFVDAFSLQFAGLCDSGSLSCQTHEWCSQFGSQRANALQWIVQLCSDKHSLPLSSDKQKRLCVKAFVCESVCASVKKHLHVKAYVCKSVCV